MTAFATSTITTIHDFTTLQIKCKCKARPVVGATISSKTYSELDPNSSSSIQRSESQLYPVISGGLFHASWETFRSTPVFAADFTMELEAKWRKCSRHKSCRS